LITSYVDNSGTLLKQLEAWSNGFPSFQPFWVPTWANQHLSMWSVWQKWRQKARANIWCEEILLIRRWICHQKWNCLLICHTVTHWHGQ